MEDDFMPTMVEHVEKLGDVVNDHASIIKRMNKIMSLIHDQQMKNTERLTALEGALKEET